MITKHEAIASGIVSLCFAQLSAKTMREFELPATCPQEGLVNLRFDEPEEQSRHLGVPKIEWIRRCNLELVVQHRRSADRIAIFEGVLAEIGAIFAPPATLLPLLLTYVDLGAPVEPDDIPMEGIASLKGAVIPLRLFYETSDNPMETYP